MAVARKHKTVYPDSDGEPIADNTLQFEWIVTLKGGLDAVFKNDPNVFVAGDLLWYPVEGNNKIRVAPDAMVVLGRPKGYRGSYMQWEENNVVPQVAFEILSAGNRPGEMNRKRAFYEQYGVQEYYLYDPYKIILEGWRRENGLFVPIEEMEGWVSPLLGVKFELDPDATNRELILTGPDGRIFASYLDIVEQRGEAELRMLQERFQREQAEELAQDERRQRERAEQQSWDERRQRERAEQQSWDERRQREQAEELAQDERRQREQAEQETRAAQERTAKLEAFLRENNLKFED